MNFLPYHSLGLGERVVACVSEPRFLVFVGKRRRGKKWGQKGYSQRKPRVGKFGWHRGSFNIPDLGRSSERESKMASTTKILSLALVLWLSLLSDWTPGAKGHETSCRKKSLFFELTEEYGNYECVKLEEESETSFDFTSSIGEGFGARNVTYEQFIVTFDESKFGGEHKQTLEKQLPAGKVWAWQERRNEASKYTTDFGVIRLPRGSELVCLLSAIKDLRGVKGVFADSAINRNLQQRAFPDKKDAKDSVKYLDIGRNFKEHQTNSLYQPELLWNRGITGKGIRVGMFDTGLEQGNKWLKNVKWRSNWTYQPLNKDGHGHGSSTSGSVASVHPKCPSSAPDIDLYTFKVFTDNSDSFTSWYMDAINFIYFVKVHLINVSIGGPDFRDAPFVDKFRQLVANGVTVFAAAGNMGPLRGTVNSPADETFVIGVGSHNYNFAISSYQSRGMSLHEKPYGYGRVVADVCAYADEVYALKADPTAEDCFLTLGTSTSTPVTAGIVALVASSIPDEEKYRKITPASLKQVVLEGSDRLSHWSMYDQGAGAINLQKAYKVMSEYEPRVSVFPPYLDLASEEEKDYFWPHSSQPVYAKSMPLMVNFTIVNGMGTNGYFTAAPRWNPTNKLGNQVRFQFDYAPVLWPWHGYLGVYMHVEDSASHSTGIAEGRITFNVSSPPFPGEIYKREQEVSIDIKLNVVPTPPRSKRVLWEDAHNLQYPYNYIPKDAELETHTYDFQGDHPHTNYNHVFNELVENGYYVEVLSSSLTCFDAAQYGMLVVIDPELEYDQEEIDKLYRDVAHEGMGLLVLADWYGDDMVKKWTLWNDNYRETMHPSMGGCNVPALNRLLSNFEIAFSNLTTSGTVNLGGKKALSCSTGSTVAKMPPKSVIFDTQDTGNKYKKKQYPVLEVTKVEEGNIVVFSDSSGFDYDISALKHGKMKGVFTDIVRYASEGVTPSWLELGTYHEEAYLYDFKNDRSYGIPDEDENLSPSKLRIHGLSRDPAPLWPTLQCFRNAPLSHQPDRTEMVRRRNNKMMEWIKWAKEKLTASPEIDHSHTSRASHGDNKSTTGSTPSVEHESDKETQGKVRESTSSGFSLFQGIGLLLIAFGVWGFMQHWRLQIRRSFKPGYSRAKQSV